MGALLALASSVLYGVADFAGGLLSRRAGFASVALVGQASGMVFMAALAPLLPGAPTITDLAWGALSGIGTGAGMAFLFRGMSRGAMSVVVPVSAVGGLAIPVLVGIVFLRDRPTTLALVGMVVAVPALWLVAPRGDSSGGTLDGLLASVFIAVQYLTLALAGPAAGLWPVLAGRVTATLAVLPIAWRTRKRAPLGSAATGNPPKRTPLDAARTANTPKQAHVGAAATGICATLALVAYLLATRTQLLSIAVVLSSLYPAIPIVLALTVLRERLTAQQVTGLAGASAAIILLTLG